MHDRVHYRLQILGSVQGVGFRATAIREAANLGVSGFVKNMPDWSVLVEVEGIEKQVKAFMAWCARGPEGTVVDKVIRKRLPTKGFNGFFLE